VPTHAAIIGLAGSALGLARHSSDLAQLSEAYARAAQIDTLGSRLTDFHTVQSPHGPTVEKIRIRTRADELTAVNPSGQPWTTITRREYLQDVAYTVVLWPLVESPWPPERIVEALRLPVHPVYAGRRSCALSAPLAPEIVEAQSLSDVLMGERIYWDIRIPAGSLEAHHEVTLNDQLVSGGPRSFVARRDCVR
jgi:CRISPR system Cascade subunit CasD